MMLAARLLCFRRITSQFPSLNGLQKTTTTSTSRRMFAEGPSTQLSPEEIRAKVGKLKARRSTTTTPIKKAPTVEKNLLIRAGLPFVLFSIFAAWVVGNAYQGKLKEYEASQGKASKSLRQAAMEEEREEILERISKIVDQDFDNTKRVKRPHEILEERRLERERRNAWHRRTYRWLFGEGKQDASK